MSDSHVCELVCWVCGDHVTVETPGPPTWVGELASWARQVGWSVGQDWDRNRTLIFCSEECLDRAFTRRGAFRVRPPKRKEPSEEVPCPTSPA